MSERGYCARCNNTGYIDCHCGGDLCICGEEEIECPKCGGIYGGDRFDDDDDWEAPLPTQESE